MDFHEKEKAILRDFVNMHKGFGEALPAAVQRANGRLKKCPVFCRPALTIIKKTYKINIHTGSITTKEKRYGQ